MTVTAKMVKDLRTMTGAGMMDCKNALTEADGDIDLANDILRKKGMKLVDKKAGREAKEGLVSVLVSGNSVGLVEINCETDFVARNEKFQDFVRDVAQRSVIDHSFTAPNKAEIVATLGENIKLRRSLCMDASGHETISTYIHGMAGENVGKIGVAVVHTGDNELGKKIAMHIAASNPKAISAEDLDPAFIEKERQIFTEQALESGKPANIVEMMVEGKMRKTFREVTLLDQPFVMEPDKTVGMVLEEANATVTGFIRLEVGE